MNLDSTFDLYHSRYQLAKEANQYNEMEFMVFYLKISLISEVHLNYTFQMKIMELISLLSLRKQYSL